MVRLLACDSLACKCDTVQKIKLGLCLIRSRSVTHAHSQLGFFFFFFLHTDIHNAQMKALSKQRGSDMHTDSN